MASYDDELSKQYHSIKFYYGTYTTKNVNYRIGNTTTVVQDETERYYDTWKTYHLIPTERPTVSLPQANTKLVSIPGKRLPIDLSSYYTGHMTYGNRTGSWSFYTDNDFVNGGGGYMAVDKVIKDNLHGKIRKVVLQDSPEYFYVGKLTVGEWKTGDDRSTVTISYDLYPYKKEMTGSLDLWKFDDFSFNVGFIQYMKDMTVNGSRIVDIKGSPERICPHIYGTDTLLVDKYENGRWINYGNVPADQTDDSSAVDNTILPGFIIGDGTNRVRFRGNGSVTIDYRRGLL